MLAFRPALIPRYHDLTWSRHAGLVIAVNAVIAWSLMALHELGHLATARAAGIPARVTISTRLQFLAAQTDVSGAWAAPRRTRMTIYLSGMTVNLIATAACILTLGLAGPHGLPRDLLAAAATESLLMIPVQFLVFMRTDVYFVIQDLAGCASLYADGTARLRYLAATAARPSRPAPADPTAGLPARQRRAVNAYSAILLAGTTACLAAEALIGIPALLTLLRQAAAELTAAPAAGKLDGAAAIAALATWQALWAAAWWHRHSPKIRCRLRRHTTATAAQT